MHPLIMGVLNVTPDSFSDGGRFVDTDQAIERGLALVAEGADLVDVGGESTRPGAEELFDAEELRRVLPVVQALAPHVRVSIDTRHRAVAEAAVDAGATLVNDISASLWDVAAQAGPQVGFVAMHMAGDPRTMQADPRYGDVVAEVAEFLRRRADAARDAGVDEVWVDPGIGFGKNTDHNLSLLRHLDVLVAGEHPVLVGTSRKRTLGVVLTNSDRGRPLTEEPDGPLVSTDDRLEGSVTTAVWALDQGARMVRVHDVRATRQAVQVLVGQL